MLLPFHCQQLELKYQRKWKAKIFILSSTKETFIFAARDPCGEAADQIRSVRSEKFST